MIVLLTIYW